MKRLFLLSLLLTSCSINNWEDANSSGAKREIYCWSGGREIYYGSTTRKIEDHPYGFSFVDSNSGQYVLVSGTCTVNFFLKNKE